MARSGAQVCALLLVACLLIAAPRKGSAITCGTVVSVLSPCINYLRGIGPLPPSCCSGVKTLNSETKTTPDRQQACACIKSAAASISGFKPPLAAGLPGKCGVSIPYPISTSTDCSKVH